MKIEEVIDSFILEAEYLIQDMHSVATKSDVIDIFAKNLTNMLSDRKFDCVNYFDAQECDFNWLNIVTLVSDRVATLHKIPIEHLSMCLRNEREKLIEHHLKHDIPFWRYQKHNALAMKVTLSEATYVVGDDLQKHNAYFMTIREASKEEYLKYLNRKKAEKGGAE